MSIHVISGRLLSSFPFLEIHREIASPSRDSNSSILQGKWDVDDMFSSHPHLLRLIEMPLSGSLAGWGNTVVHFALEPGQTALAPFSAPFPFPSFYWPLLIKAPLRDVYKLVIF